VDVAGNVAVIGAPGDDEEATNAGAAYVFVRQGGGWSQVQKLTAEDDAVQHDAFGWDVAVERDLIVVGTPGDDDAAGGGSDSGAVYVFEHDGISWERIIKLLPNDMSNAAYAYGTSVDIAIDVPDEHGPAEVTTLAVGAPKADQAEGVVFLYRRNGVLWNLIGRLSDSDTMGPNDNGELGIAVAIRGDSLIAGAPLDDQLGSNVGAAYHFGRGQIVDSWVETAALLPSDPLPGDMFGAAVAVARELDFYVLAIGAPSQSPARAGRVFVYDAPGDPEVLTAGDIHDGFGSAVAIDTRLLLVGAPGDDDGGQDAGAVYCFFRDQLGVWQSDGKIVASDAGIEKEFGWDVALGLGSAIIGRPEEDAVTAGAAYLYTTSIFTDGFESGDTSAWSAVSP
jgi:hypothetical protein